VVQEEARWVWVGIGALIFFVLPAIAVMAQTSGSTTTSTIDTTPTVGYTTTEKTYLAIVRSEGNSDGYALGKVVDYCNRYPDLSSDDVIGFGASLGIIVGTATDWSNTNPGPPSARWDAFDSDYANALNALSAAANQMATGLDNNDPQALQSANILMSQGSVYIDTALGEKPVPQ
jgi:hypothetical protein